MTLLVVTRAAAFGAAQLGFLICLVFAGIFGLMVFVGGQRHKAQLRRAAATTTDADDATDG